MEKNVDHIQLSPTFVEDNLSYLPEALQKDLLSKFVQVELDRYKVVDDTLYYLAINRLLANATGTYLEDIGARFQIYRNGLDDESYRATLFLKTGEAQKHGTHTDIISILYQLLGEGTVYTYKGNNFRFDVALSSPCFDVNTTAEDIANLTPLVTELRIVDGLGYPFGFDGDDDCGGFASVVDVTTPDFNFGSIGGFYSIRYQPTPDA